MGGTEESVGQMAMVHGLAGTLGSTISIALTYPLLTVTTRMQVEQKSEDGTKGQSQNPLKAVFDIVRREGASALYGGIRPALVGTAVSMGIYFYVFEVMKKTVVHYQRGPLGAVESLVLGYVAGCINVTLTCPIWVVTACMQAHQRKVRGWNAGEEARKSTRRLRLRRLRSLRRRLCRDGDGDSESADGEEGGEEEVRALEERAKISSASSASACGEHEEREHGRIEEGLGVRGNVQEEEEEDEEEEEEEEEDARSTVAGTVKEILREHGPSGFFKGLPASIVLCANPAIQWMCYEQLTQIVRRLLARRENGRPAQLSSLQVFLVGALAKVIATLLTYPYVMVKSRLQTSKNSKDGKGYHYKGIVDGLQSIYNTEGLAGLYRGIRTKILQSVTTTAFMYTIKERLVIVAAFIVLGRNRALKLR